MGLIGFLKRIFTKRRPPEALEPSIEALEAPFSKIKALEQIASSDKDLQEKPPLMIQPVSEPPKSIILEKNSLQLGVAAGYTGRSIKGIESSLDRIETQMITKDWFTSKFEDRASELIEVLGKHEENSEKRFETIQNLIISIQKTAEKAPEPIKTELIEKIEAIEKQLPPTPKMQGLLLIVKDYGEISYTDLASKLGISLSALRGLLTTTARRTDKIQRFSKQGKGWVKYIGE